MAILLLCFKLSGCLPLYFEVLYHGHVIWLQPTSEPHLVPAPFLVHLTVVTVLFSVFHQSTKLVPASGPQHLVFPLPEHSSLRSTYSWFIFIQISVYRSKVSSPDQSGEYYLLPSLTPEKSLPYDSSNFIII